MTKILLRAENLNKRFISYKKGKNLFRLIRSLLLGETFSGSYCALNDLTFEIEKGAKLALVGGNGAGKTTLLRILSGIYAQTSGFLEVLEFPSAFFRFWIGSTRELSVEEMVYLLAAIYQMSPPPLSDKVDIILKMAGLSEMKEIPTKVLSSGEYQRLALSVFFHCESEFVIFDEGLTYLDVSFLHHCEQYFENLLKSPKTVILTSHDSNFLRKYCTSALWLDHGSLRMKGEINEVLSAYESSTNSNK